MPAPARLIGRARLEVQVGVPGMVEPVHHEPVDRLQVLRRQHVARGAGRHDLTLVEQQDPVAEALRLLQSRAAMGRPGP